MSLRADLQTMVRTYRALTYRGGIDADVETQTDLTEEFGIAQSTSVTETRKYAYHRKIERNRTATKKAKSFMVRAARPAILVFRSGMVKSVRGSLKRTTSNQSARWKRASRCITISPPILRYCAR